MLKRWGLPLLVTMGLLLAIGGFAALAGPGGSSLLSESSEEDAAGAGEEITGASEAVVCEAPQVETVGQNVEIESGTVSSISGNIITISVGGQSFAFDLTTAGQIVGDPMVNSTVRLEGTLGVGGAPGTIDELQVCGAVEAVEEEAAVQEAMVEPEECNRGPGTAGEFRLRIEDGDVRIDRATVLDTDPLTVGDPDRTVSIALSGVTATGLAEGDEVRVEGTRDGSTVNVDRFEVLCPHESGDGADGDGGHGGDGHGDGHHGDDRHHDDDEHENGED